MAEHTFDVAAFRLAFPQFADATKYPDEMLSGYFVIATCYVNPNDGCTLNGTALQTVLQLVTAHVAAINTTTTGEVVANGGNVGVITSSTIDRVSVTRQVPKTEGAWQTFLASTPYGMQAWALLRAKGAGGWMVGGSRERQAFRGAGGRFGG
jgi:hypothetical protein